MANTERQGGVDALTLGGVAALAYSLSTQMHEAGGHGLTCLAVGGLWKEWGAYYVDCDSAARGALAGRIVDAAGSTVNLAIGAMALLLLRLAPIDRPVWRWFLWLMLAINLFDWAGYYLFSGASGLGDWGADGVFRGVEPQWGWRLGLTVIGGALYYGAAVFAARELGRLAGPAPGAKRAASRACLIAYLAGGGIAIATGLLNPKGIVIVLISAAASSLGGTSGLLWLTTRLPQSGHGGPLAIPRSWPWIFAGLLAATAVAAVLGPTLVVNWRWLKVR